MAIATLALPSTAAPPHLSTGNIATEIIDKCLAQLASSPKREREDDREEDHVGAKRTRIWGADYHTDETSTESLDEWRFLPPDVVENKNVNLIEEPIGPEESLSFPGGQDDFCADFWSSSMNTDLFSSSSEESLSECSEGSESKLFPEDMTLSEIIAHDHPEMADLLRASKENGALYESHAPSHDASDSCPPNSTDTECVALEDSGDQTFFAVDEDEDDEDMEPVNFAQFCNEFDAGAIQAAPQIPAPERICGDPRPLGSSPLSNAVSEDELADAHSSELRVWRFKPKSQSLRVNMFKSIHADERYFLLTDRTRATVYDRDVPAVTRGTPGYCRLRDPLPCPTGAAVQERYEYWYSGSLLKDPFRPSPQMCRRYTYLCLETGEAFDGTYFGMHPHYRAYVEAVNEIGHMHGQPDGTKKKVIECHELMVKRVEDAEETTLRMRSDPEARYAWDRYAAAAKNLYNKIQA